MDRVLVVVAWLAAFVQIYEFLRLVVRTRKVTWARRRGLPYVSANQRPKSFTYVYYRYVLGVAIGAAAALLYAVGFYRVPASLGDLQAALAYTTIAILILGGFWCASRALDLMRLLDAFHARYAKDELPLTTDQTGAEPVAPPGKTRRSLWAYRTLMSGRYQFGPGQPLLTFTIIFPLIMVLDWYAGQDSWLGFTLRDLVSDPTAARFTAMGGYTGSFVLALALGWALGVLLTPIRPSRFRVVVVLPTLIVCAAAGAAAATLLLRARDLNLLITALGAAAVSGLMVGLTAVLGGLTWAQYHLARNPGLEQFPKILRLRYWFGGPQVAALAVFGIANNKIGNVVAFAALLLAVGLFSRPPGNPFIGALAGIVIGALVARLNLNEPFGAWLDEGGSRLAATTGAFLLTAEITGAAFAALISLAPPGLPPKSGKVTP